MDVWFSRSEFWGRIKFELKDCWGIHSSGFATELGMNFEKKDRFPA